jgi:hypothetical protein
VEEKGLGGEAAAQPPSHPKDAVIPTGVSTANEVEESADASLLPCLLPLRSCCAFRAEHHHHFLHRLCAARVFACIVSATEVVFVVKIR